MFAAEQVARMKEQPGVNEHAAELLPQVAVTTMLAFCHWLEREEKIEKPITTRFKLPRVEKKFVPTYEVEDVGKLLKACEEGDESNPTFRKALTTRNKAIVVLFIDTGIRLSELVGLRLGDIDRRSRVILVHRKGNKWQQVPVSREGFMPLHSYLSNHRAVLAGSKGDDYRPRKDDAVFLANDGEPLTIWGVSMLFKRLKKQFKRGIWGGILERVTTCWDAAKNSCIPPSLIML